MKTHTSSFKEQIKLMGKEIDSRITFGDTVLGKNDLNAVTPSYQGAILKSVMKQLDIDSNVAIPIGTNLKYEFGLKVNGQYEYINYGNYIVYSIEKQEDTNSYKILCYDKMLLSMKNYEKMPITYPISVRNYINAICDYLGIVFASVNDDFANFNKIISSELYFDSDGNSLDYTFRDVLDELAQVTASTICINDNDELEIRYITNTFTEIKEESGSYITINSEINEKLMKFEIEGKSTQETRSGKNIFEYNRVHSSVGGLTSVVNEDGSITTSGVPTQNYVAIINNYQITDDLDDGEYYTFSQKYAQKELYMQLVQASIDDGSNTYMHISSASINSKTFLVDKSKYKYYIMLQTGIMSNWTEEKTITNFYQLEKGSTATEFEKYGVSPSPDYHSEINSVGYENLFNKSKVEIGKSWHGGSNVNRASFVIEYEQNKDYSITLDNFDYISSIAIVEANEIVGSGAVYTQIFNDIFKFTHKMSSTAKFLCIQIETTDIFTEEILNQINIQLNEDVKVHKYIPYGKYGIEVETVGKNLFNNNDVKKGYYYLYSSIGTSSNWAIAEIKVKSNTNYYLSGNNYDNSAAYICLLDKDKNIISTVGNYKNTHLITTTNDTAYIGLSIADYSGDGDMNTLQLEEGSVSTEYEEYKSSSQVLVLDQPLRSLPNGVKDIAYIRNNKLYVDRYVRSVIFNGSENWEIRGTGTSNWFYRYASGNSANQNTLPLSNYYEGKVISSSNTEQGIYMLSGGDIRIRYGTEDSIENFKTWLLENNIKVEYELAEPYTEELGKIEMLTTFIGANNITTSDELEPIINIKYSESFETIDEELLKDINVNFSEKFGKVNTIVLSRSAGSDNIYYPESLPENPYEIKISDNQIMNFNDRSEYLPAIYEKLNGLEFYTNDFVSTGICYLDLCDKYLVKIGDNNYPCVMFNDEVLVTQGLEENIFTEKPQETETDYIKADKTDRKINQTYLIVDKQNGQIESVVSQTEAQNEKIAKVIQTVEELNSKISEVADVTVSAEDNDSEVELDNINESEPIRIVVKPIGKNITYLYPRNNLYPSNNLFPKIRTIRFTNTKNNEIVDYELPADLLYYDSDHYDEFILDYDGQSCIINKRVEYNEDGTTYILSNEKTIEFEYPRILLSDGDYSINIVGYDTAYLFVRLMAQNIYTTQFATKAELTSEISQTSKEINLEVSKKVGKEEVISSINQTAEQIKINASKININGVITAINNDSSTTINGDKIKTGTLTADQINGGTITASAINLGGGTFTASTIGTIKASSGNIAGFGLDGTSGFSSDYATLRPNGNLLLYPSYGSARYVLSNAMTFNAQNGIVIASNSNANVSAPTNNLDLKACSGATAYLACMGNSDGTNERSSVNCTDGILKFTSSGYCTYNGSTVFGSSSKATKENIVDLTEEQKEEVYNLIKNIPTKQFDYKKEYGKPFNYGFIIEDIENTKLNDLLHITQAENNKNIKMYSTEDLARLELITIQNLMKKIENLENKIKELESDK